MKTKKILLDLDCRKNSNQFTVEGVHQGDVNTIEFVISLLNLGENFEVSENYSVRICGVKDDGKCIFNECDVDEEGNIRYVLQEQDTATSGMVNYQLIISGETDGKIQVLTTPSFYCHVEQKNVDPTYVELKAKPSDWETAYSKYFKKDEIGYIPVESVNDWAEGEIYFCDGIVESSHQLDVLTNLIHKVQNLSTEGGVVENFEISSDGELVLKFSNGNERILGTVKGTDGVDGQDGIDGIDGIDGKDGANGENGKDGISCAHSFSGTVLTVTSASGTSSADLKGEKGDKGDTGEKGADGYTPIKGTDYFTESDKTEMVDAVKTTCLAKNHGSANAGKILVVGTDGNITLTDMPEGGVSGDVTGVIDNNNNILLSGNLARGIYTLKYENSDGTYTDVGTLEVGAIPEPEPAYINLAEPTSEDWQEGYRLSLSSGSTTTSDADGHTTTNYIKCTVGDVLRVKGLTFHTSTTSGGGGSSPKIVWYNSGKTKITGMYGVSTSGSDQAYGLKVTVGGDISTYTVAIANNGTQYADSQCAYIRIDGFLMDGYTKDDVIITVNQEIV